MSEPTPAVFLSYASQDAEAARRICAALRAAGVEVWFDQNELVGGDAWDQKIRKQIGSCALLIPIISASTQARREGYFRLEWRLAVERMRQMDDDLPFLLPVVIDDTSDAGAFVPEKFREVQWTRLKGGEIVPAFVGRVQKLLGASVVGAPPDDARGRAQGAPLRRSRPRWLVPVILGTVAIAGATVWLAREPAPDPNSPDPKSQTPAQTEARELVTKAWEQLNRTGLYRTELEIADGLLKRAAELAQDDPEVWAAWTHVEAWYVYHNLDLSPERREGARQKAARAMRLDSQSFEARLADACYTVRATGPQPGAGRAGDAQLAAEQTLRDLVRERPDDHRPRFALGVLLRNVRRFDEGAAEFERMALLPGRTATAWNEIGWLRLFAGDSQRAVEAADRSIAAQPYYGNLLLRLQLARYWTGDLELAKSAAARLPPSLRTEDIIVASTVELFRWRREPAEMLRILEAVPRAWIASQGFSGPKFFLVAEAHRMAGREDAAQLGCREALRLIEQRLDQEPGSAPLLTLKARTLWALGRQSEARQTARLAESFGAANNLDLLLELGELDRALAELERLMGAPTSEVSGVTRWAELKLNPRFDPVRSDPRFQRLLEQAEADPRRNPHAKTRRESSDMGAADAKSVAVLPFANLSDDKEQEYFSDGLTEEILNALARERDLRVPGRSSSFSFKGRNVSSVEIARALNVSRLVEGSVRKSGNKVRISVSLTRASDGFSEELGTFTEELNDIFALQDKVARTVVEKLTRRTVTRAAVGLTKNTEAYDSYLRGRALQTRSPLFTPDAIQHYERAVALDPEFALAWARLAQARFRTFQSGNDHCLAVINGTREAIDRALAAQPDLPEALIMRANWVRSVQSDYPAARRDLERAEALQPATADLRFAQGQLERELGNYADAFRLFREALQLEPQNADFANSYAVGLCLPRGEFVEADQLIRRAMEIQGAASFGFFSNLIWVRNLWRGPEAALRLLDRAPASQAGRGQMRVNLLVRLGRLDEARREVDRLEQKAGPAGSIALIGSGLDFVEPENLLALGREEAARQRAGEMVAEATQEFARGNRAPLVREAFIGGEIVLGHRESALAALAEWRAEAQRLTSTYRRSTEFSSPAMALYARLGQVDEVVALLRDMQANGLRSHRGLRHDPDFAALRDDARFQELLRQLEAWTKTLPDPADL